METAYRKLKHDGAVIAEFPCTHKNGTALRIIYVATVPNGVRIGVLHGPLETSFIIPSVVLEKVADALVASRGRQ